MDLGRAIGFIGGGALQGYGQGMVEQAKVNWERMLKEEDNARADARQASQQTFESGQTAQKIGAEKDIAATHEAGANTRSAAEVAGRKDIAGTEAKSRKDVADIEAASRKDAVTAGLNELARVAPDPKTGKLVGLTKGGDRIDLGIDSPAEAKDLELKTDDQGALRVVDKLHPENSRVVTDTATGKPVYAQVKGDPLSELLGGGSGVPNASTAKSPPPVAATGFGGGTAAPAASADDMLGPDASLPAAAAAPAQSGPPRYVADPKTGKLTQQLSDADKQASIANAKAAIAKGADRNATLKRLRDAGIDTSGL